MNATTEDRRTQPDEATALSASSAARGHIRGSSLFLAGNMLSLAITFVPHLILVRYFTTDAFAHMAYALSLVAAAKTYSLGFNEALSRFVPIFHARHEPHKVLGSIVVVFSVTIAISTALIAGFALAHRAILAALTKGREPADLLLLLMFLVPLESIDLLIMNLFACFGMTREILWGRFLVPPTLRVIVTTMVVLQRGSPYLLAKGYVLAELMTVITFGVIAIHRLRRRVLLDSIGPAQLPAREIFGFSAPLLASNLVGMLGSSIPVMLLGYFHPMSAVAYFRVVLPAACLTSIIPSNFMPLFMPSASRLYARGDIEGINHLFWETSIWMSVLAFPIFIATFCFSRPLTTLLYGVRYAESAPILSILSLAYFVNVIFAFSSVTLKVLGRIRRTVLLNLVTPLGIVMLNVILIPRYGAIGAAIGTATGMILQNLLRQLGLWSGSEQIRLFDFRYSGFFAILGGGATAICGIEAFLPRGIYVALITAPAVWLFALWTVKRHLGITRTFPELARIPVIGQILS